jgi:hypothetical protein
MHETVLLQASVLLLKELLYRFCSIDELLEVVVEACQIVLSLLVFSNQGLLLLQKLLSLRFQGLTLRAFVFYASDHERILIRFCHVRVLLEELVEWNQRQRLVLVPAMISASSHSHRTADVSHL